MVTPTADSYVDLVMPSVPVVSTVDSANFVSITAPTGGDDTCIQNIQVVLAGFTDETDEFIFANERAWINAGYTHWPYKSDYKYDGYAIVFEFEILDGQGFDICVQLGTDTDNDDFSCFAIEYDEAKDPNVVE
jgi:hypothetical protein